MAVRLAEEVPRRSYLVFIVHFFVLFLLLSFVVVCVCVDVVVVVVLFYTATFCMFVSVQSD